MPTVLSFNRSHSYEEADGQAISIPIRLLANDRAVRFDAKIDTGADYCLFDRQWAERLRINVEAGEKTSFWSVSGRFEAYRHLLTIETLGTHLESEVYFARYAGPSRNLLGRSGWLEHFRIAIVHYDRELFLSPTSNYFGGPHGLDGQLSVSLRACRR